MVVAHFGPDGGLWALSERVTAPLFALLVGVGVLLTWQRRTSNRGFLVAEAYRSLVLVLLGVGLQRCYDQIDVVLPTLGALSLVLAILTMVLQGRPAMTLAAATVAGLTAWPLEQAARQWLGTGGGDSAASGVVNVLAAGQNYRVATFLIFALVGQAALPWVTNPSRPPRQLMGTSAALAVLAGVGFLVGKRVLGGAEAYSGSYGEIITAVPLVLATWVGCTWLAAVAPRPWLTPLLDTGRTTLTAYAVQVLLARGLVDTIVPGGRDDHWWMVVTQLVVAIGGSVWWQHRLGTGPLEWVLRLPTRGTRSPRAG